MSGFWSRADYPWTMKNTGRFIFPQVLITLEINLSLLGSIMSLISGLYLGFRGSRSTRQGEGVLSGSLCHLFSKEPSHLAIGHQFIVIPEISLPPPPSPGMITLQQLSLSPPCFGWSSLKLSSSPSWSGFNSQPSLLCLLSPCSSIQGTLVQGPCIWGDSPHMALLSSLFLCPAPAI